MHFNADICSSLIDILSVSGARLAPSIIFREPIDICQVKLKFIINCKGLIVWEFKFFSLFHVEKNLQVTHDAV